MSVVLARRLRWSTARVARSYNRAPAQRRGDAKLRETDVSERDNGELQITFHGAGTRGNSVPVDILATSLRALQSVVQIIAANRHTAESSSGGTTPLSADIRQHYAVTCHPPVAGSYAVPVAIGGSRIGQPPSDASVVLGDLRTLLSAAQNQREDDLDRLLPAPETRAAAARALHKMVPKPRSGTQLTIESSAGRQLFAPDQRTCRFLKALAAPRPTVETEESVIGELGEIDFRKKRIRLHHPPSEQELACAYPQSAEDMLIESRRGLIQVIGEVAMGADEIPSRIRRVDAIRPVDLSPIQLSAFDSGADHVKAKGPIIFRPAIEDGFQHFVLTETRFGLHLLSVTRSELEADLQVAFDVLWRNFACAEDAILRPRARELKRQLHLAFSTA